MLKINILITVSLSSNVNRCPFLKHPFEMRLERKRSTMFGYLTNLCRLTGVIPPELGNAVSLQSLELGNNKVIGYVLSNCCILLMFTANRLYSIGDPQSSGDHTIIYPSTAFFWAATPCAAAGGQPVDHLRV